MRPRRRQWVAAALLLAVLAAAAGAQPEVAEPGPAHEPLATAWVRRMPGIIALAVSPGGERVLSADLDGTVVSCDRRGYTVWERRIEGVDSLAVSRAGRLALAYAANQPLSRQVWFMDEAGRRIQVLEPTEPVQAAVVSPDGAYAAIAAGRSVVFCARRAGGIRTRVLPMPGETRQVQFGPGDSLYVACREPDLVLHVKSTGRVLWQRRAAGVGAYSICASADGKMLAIGSEGPADRVNVSLVDSRSASRWADARPGRAPRVRLSAGGGAVVLSYEHKVEHNSDSRFERRITYLGRGAGGSWPKGGPFTAPLHVALDRDGEWVVVLDTQPRPGRSQPPRFRLYGRGGERRWVYTCPAGILIATASAEGRHVAAYRTDGFLEFIRVVPER